MAYADTLRAPTANLEDVADYIEGLLVTKASYSATSAGLSTTSVSYGAMTNVQVTVTAPSANCYVRVSGLISLSMSANNAYVQAVISEDSTTTTTLTNRSMYKEGNTNTNGYNTTIPVFGIFAPSAGSHIYRILWLVSANTAYSDSQHLTAEVIRA